MKHSHFNSYESSYQSSLAAEKAGATVKNNNVLSKHLIANSV